jgi:small-conductance mechanosensitive channel
MNWWPLASWPVWATRAAASVAALAAGWAIGWIIAVVTVPRALRWVSDGSPHVRSALKTLRRRLPFWGMLIAAWQASSLWPLAPDAHRLITEIVFVLGALSITFALASMTGDFVDHYGTRLAPELPVSSLTRNIVRAFVLALGGLVVLNGLGVSITPMLTALGIGGLAVALALQEPLANFFAGFFVSIAGQIRVGDYVILDSGQEGYIADISWRSTRIRMLANNLIVVPNSKLSQSVVVNYHLPSNDLAVLVEVGVDYASDLGRVEQVTIEVARDVMREVPGGVADFEPFIRYHTFADSSINYTTILRAREYVDQYLVKHEFVKRLHARFNQEGIVIPFPIRTLVHRDPQTT